MGAYKDFSILLFGDSISRIRELENFLLHSMENVDICIELMRIREFDSSGGRNKPSSILFFFCDSVIQSQELENFLLRAVKITVLNC